jgi:hypothetical protein
MYHMYQTFYYVGYRDVYIERRIAKMHPDVDDHVLDRLIHVAKEAELEHRRAKALMVARPLGISENNIIVESHGETLAEDGPYMKLVRSEKPAVLVMDSMSMYLHQLGLSYWITLLRTTLQHGVLPITIEEHARDVHKDFENTLRNRRVSIEALTEHIRPEPKRVVGRRKHGPISEVVGQVLVESATRAVGSSDDVMDAISRWYGQYLLDPKDHMHQYAIFEQVRWKTYKYKVRNMIRKMLVECWENHHPDLPIQHDIWQTSFFISGEMFYPSAIAAGLLLPEYGYEKVGSRWEKVSSATDSD